MNALEQRLVAVIAALMLWIVALLLPNPVAPENPQPAAAENIAEAEPEPATEADADAEAGEEREPGFAKDTFRTQETEHLIVDIDDLRSYEELAGEGLVAPALSLFQYSPAYEEIRNYREEQREKQLAQAAEQNETPAEEILEESPDVDETDAPPLPEAEEGDDVEVTATEADESTRRLFSRGAEAFATGNWEEAEEIYKKVLEDIPDHPATLVNLGLVEEKLGNEAEAIEYLEKAVREVPDSVPANTVLGLIYSRNGKLTQAMARLSLAVALAPNDPQTHNHLGVVFAQRGWRPAAESEFRTAIELNPLYAEAHFNLALMYLERRPASVELARRHYMTAIELGAAPDPQVEEMLAAVRPLQEPGEDTTAEG